MTILEALPKLDPKNDAHWTADGLPKADIVSKLVGATLTREDISEEAPEFCRGTQSLPVQAKGQLEVLQEKLATIDLQMGELNKQRTQVMRSLDELIEVVEKQQKDGNSIVSFLQRQQEIQLEQAEERHRLAERLGILPSQMAAMLSPRGR